MEHSPICDILSFARYLLVAWRGGLHEKNAEDYLNLNEEGIWEVLRRFEDGVLGLDDKDKDAGTDTDPQFKNKIEDPVRDVMFDALGIIGTRIVIIFINGVVVGGS